MTAAAAQGMGQNTLTSEVPEHTASPANGFKSDMFIKLQGFEGTVASFYSVTWRDPKSKSFPYKSMLIVMGLSFY